MKLIVIIGIIIAAKYLLSAALSGGTLLSLLFSVGGPILIIFIILGLLRSKRGKTGIDEIDRYL